MEGGNSHNNWWVLCINIIFGTVKYSRSNHYEGHLINEGHRLAYVKAGRIFWILLVTFHTSCDFDTLIIVLLGTSGSLNFTV